MRRHRHHHARAVVRHHEVRSVQWHLGTVNRIDRIGAGEAAEFFGGLTLALLRRRTLDLIGKGRHRRAMAGGYDALQQRMIGGDRHERDAEHRIRAGGEYRQFDIGMTCHGEVDFSADAFADPVALLRQHRIGPAALALQLLSTLQKFFGVRGDAHIPRRQLFLNHRHAGAPAHAVDDLLVGQHGVQASRPIHQRTLVVDQTFFDQIQEHILLTLGIARIAAREFARPRVRKSHALQLATHVVDVLVGPCLRMRIALDGGLFSGQAERVPAHRMQHMEATHAFVARHGVADGVVAHVTHMQLAAGIRKHLQHVITFFTRQVVAYFVRLQSLPACLPGRLDGGGFVDSDVAHDDLSRAWYLGPERWGKA